MKLKILIFTGIFLFLFLGKIAISFSYKGDDNRNIPTSEFVPLSHKLTNNVSSNPSTAEIDTTIKQFMRQHGIVGASLAITRKGRLIYSKGFGYADEETGELVKPESLFRIASVSKLITAVAIMKLVEDERLRLNTPVFGPEGILNDSIYRNYTDKRVEQITIHELLDHTAGWSHKKADPLFMPLYVAKEMGVQPPADIKTIIQYALKKKLDFNPGTKYSYSNLGYAILGQVIEKITGMPYEDYVQFAILHPLGIYDMHIGKSYFDEKYPNEVKYYEPKDEAKCYAFDGSGKLVPMTYGGNNIQLLGAAGGWIASATELIKLVVAIDGFDSKPDILSKKIIREMTKSNKRTKKLIGWRGTDGYDTWWRTGTLTGTSALVMRQRNEINWVILFNTSTDRKSKIHNDISRTMFQALRHVDSWPDVDLFNDFPVANHSYLTYNSIKK